MRRAAKIDANQAEIVAALERVGCTVLSLAPMGRGCPDLLVARGMRTVLLEVKMPKGRLTPDQVRFLSWWRGEWFIVDSIDAALAAMGVG